MIHEKELSTSSDEQEAAFYQRLVDRLGEDFLRRRFAAQMRHAEFLFNLRFSVLHIQNVGWITVFIYWFLKLTGTYNWGYRNFLDVQIKSNDVWIPDLPAEFDGFRLLHLSDLHLDMDPAITDVIISRVKQVDYDLAVVTGDYRAHTGGVYDLALEETAKLMAHVKKPVIGVMGNHDYVEFIPSLEDDSGMTLLINESLEYEHNGAKILISGVDDPHLYQMVDFERTLAGADLSLTKILLTHSPECFHEAAELGYDLLLAGHTHGGQICLPGGIPMLTHADCPRYMLNGPWQYDGMHGYTSPGTGSCGVPVRYFCPPEMTVQVLRRGSGDKP